MKAIISAIKGIFDILNLLSEIVFSSLNSLINLIKYLSKALSIGTAFILTFPEWLRVFAGVTIAISILYMVLGREGGAK